LILAGNRAVAKPRRLLVKADTHIIAPSPGDPIPSEFKTVEMG